MEDKGHKLYRKYRGKKMKFMDLPEYAKKAVEVYFIEEFEMDIYGNTVFGYVEIPRIELEKHIENGVDFRYNNFEEYHQWYMGGGDIPEHTEVWAVILDSDIRTDEVLLDGWHRFHCYVEQGIETIPAILPMFTEE